MLSFNQQYDIANGIFLTYDSQLDYRLMHSKHKQGTRESMKMSFPYHKYEAVTKEIFVLACIYIMYTKTPSSYRAFIEELREVEIKDVGSFKHKIINYQDYMAKDVAYLKNVYGSSLDPQKVLTEFLDNKIQFYTAHWFIKVYSQEWVPGRTFTHIMRKLKFVMLFLTFKEESVKTIRGLFSQIEL